MPAHFAPDFLTGRADLDRLRRMNRVDVAMPERRPDRPPRIASQCGHPFAEQLIGDRLNAAIVALLTLHPARPAFLDDARQFLLERPRVEITQAFQIDLENQISPFRASGDENAVVSDGPFHLIFQQRRV